MNLENAGHVDAAADDLVAGFGISGQRFPGQSRRVQGGSTFYDHTVNGHLLTGLDNDDAPHIHFIGIHLFQLAVPFHIGVIGTDVHQIADIAAASAHGIALEPLAHLIEQHDGDNLQVLAVFIDGQGQRAQSGHSHQKVFVKYLPVADPLERLFQNVVSDNQIVYQMDGQADPPASCSQLVECFGSQRLQSQQQYGGDQNTPQHNLLLSGHTAAFLLPHEQQNHG